MAAKTCSDASPRCDRRDPAGARSVVNEKEEAVLTIEKRADGVLHIVADGQLTTEDYAEFVPRFEKFAQAGPNAMRIELGPSFTGWSLAALWRDIRFDLRHWKQFGRMAVIGDKRWEKWGTDLTDPFVPGEMKFFERGSEAEADEWLRSRGGDAPADLQDPRPGQDGGSR